MATSTSRGASKPALPAGRLRQGAWLLALALVAVLMLRASLSDVVARFDPELALRIDPGNGQAAVARAEQLMSTDLNRRAEIETLARKGLRRSPLSAAGARTIGLMRGVAGDAGAQARLMAYAESLSRRDLPTQVWQIQDAVDHDDVPRALHHYDIALRSADQAQPALFPVLIQALAQPPVVEGLINMLAARPPWAKAFVMQAGQQAGDMDGLARLLTGLAQRKYPIPSEAAVPASLRMADAGHFDDAWQVYAATHRGAVRAQLRDPTFADISDAAAPFGWSISTANGILAEPRRFGDQDALAYSAQTGGSGVVARQLLLFPAGTFRLTGRSFDRAPDAPPAQIRLTCRASGLPIATVPAATAVFAQDFAVPVDCAAQVLEILVDGGDAPQGASGGIGDLRIVRAQGGRS